MESPVGSRRPIAVAHHPPAIDRRQILSVTPLETGTVLAGKLEVAGAWQLESPNHHFGGYSALLALPDGNLFAASDGGRMLRFAPPDGPGGAAEFDHFAVRKKSDRALRDLEGLTRDPASGKMWAVYEGRNMILRLDPDFRRTGAVRPAAMRNWPGNAGPEAIVRLADGRFVVLSEGSPRWFARGLPALLFPGDPVSGAEPAEFTFVPPRGYRPVDAALLPDGRVLVLVRQVRWRLPPRFAAKLVVADPASIRPGRRWSGATVAEIDAPLPTDNYEGLAVEPQENGRAAVWLISDDNRAHYQRTLLLKLAWPPNEKARGTSRAPS